MRAILNGGLSDGAVKEICDVDEHGNPPRMITVPRPVVTSFPKSNATDESQAIHVKIRWHEYRLRTLAGLPVMTGEGYAYDYIGCH